MRTTTMVCPVQWRVLGTSLTLPRFSGLLDSWRIMPYAPGGVQAFVRDRAEVADRRAACAGLYHASIHSKIADASSKRSPTRAGRAARVAAC